MSIALGREAILAGYTVQFTTATTLAAGLAKARAFAEDDPGNFLYDIVSAELYEKAGQKDEAVALLEKASAGHPTDDNLVIALSRLYARNGAAAKAETVLNDRVSADPKDISVRSGCRRYLCWNLF